MEKKQNVNRKRKKKIFKVWKVVMLTIVLAVLVAFGAGGGIVLAFVNTAPVIDLEAFTNLSQTSRIYDKDGKQVEDIHGVENRTYVPLSKMPKYTQDAFIAIEDERYRQHFGVDIKRIFGALWVDLRDMDMSQGASTITQQLIKNTFFSNKKEWKRKIQEAYMAVKLERMISKDQILEYYLNTIFLGGSANGVQAAAEYYFGKNVDQLTIGQSALIAGINQSPSRYNPYLNEDSPDVYKNRQVTVLSKMLEHNYITNEEFEAAKKEELVFKKKDDISKMKYQWFIEAALDSVAEDLKTKYHYTDDEVHQSLYSGGLKIYTTLDPKIQQIAEKVINNTKYYPKLKKDIATWGTDKIIQPQGAVVVNDYKTGHVRAIVGGRGPQPLKSQNRAADPRYARQPGSSMKPLAVYGPALDMGYSPGSVGDDSPFTSEMRARTKWNPKEWDGKYWGLMTFREAVKWSRNIIPASLIMELGPSKSAEYVEKFGITTVLTKPDKNGKTDAIPSLALGGMTHGVIPLDMSAAYGVFGNGGIYVEPILYTKVLDSDGNILLEKKPEKHKVISAQAAYLMTDMLRGVVQSGTGTRARVGSMPVAGKTGTTNDNTNAYFAGFTPYYSAAVWMGHDKPSVSIPVTSGETAEMWAVIMKDINSLYKLPVKNFSRPGGIVNASICIDSGKRATDLCSKDQRGSRVKSDMFVSGTVPTESCDIHVSAMVDTTTGKLATEFCPIEFVKETVFIKRPYTVSKNVRDFKYQLPTDKCDVHTSLITPTPTPGDDDSSGGLPGNGPTVTPTPSPTSDPKGKSKPKN